MYVTDSHTYVAQSCSQPHISSGVASSISMSSSPGGVAGGCPDRRNAVAHYLPLHISPYQKHHRPGSIQWLALSRGRLTHTAEEAEVSLSVSNVGILHVHVQPTFLHCIVAANNTACINTQYVLYCINTQYGQALYPRSI